MLLGNGTVRAMKTLSGLQRVTRDNLPSLSEEDLNAIHRSADEMRRYMDKLFHDAFDADTARRREAMEEAYKRNTKRGG